MVDRPQTLGFQADMAHTLLFTLGYNAPEDRLLPEDFDWSDRAKLDAALCKIDRTRCGPGRSISTWPRTTARSKGRARTTRPAATACRAIPNGKLDIVRDAGDWMRGDDGEPTRAFQHICWDGCMFPNAVMMDQKTWHDVLGAMMRCATRTGGPVDQEHGGAWLGRRNSTSAWSATASWAAPIPTRSARSNHSSIFRSSPC